MLHPSFDACFWENFKGHLLASPKPEVLSVSQVVVMKTPGYCWRVLLLKILFIFSIYMHPLEKAMAPHSSVLAWRIPGTEEPAGLPSMGSRRVGHDWSDLAAAAARASSWDYTCHFLSLSSALPPPLPSLFSCFFPPFFQVHASENEAWNWHKTMHGWVFAIFQMKKQIQRDLGTYSCSLC